MGTVRIESSEVAIIYLNVTRNEAGGILSTELVSKVVVTHLSDRLVKDHAKEGATDYYVLPYKKFLRSDYTDLHRVPEGYPLIALKR